MKVTLLAHTPNPEELIAMGYGICTGKETIPLENIGRWIEDGHMSPVEHASASFRISGISRTCSHQLVRHRLASYSQKSQRYCNEENFSAVIPDSFRNLTAAEFVFNEMVLTSQLFYKKLVDDGVPEEDARFVLPNATSTELIMSANFREWIHMIDVRLSPHAQWEIRELAWIILDKLNEIAPNVFGHMIHKKTLEYSEMMKMLAQKEL